MAADENRPFFFVLSRKIGVKRGLLIRKARVELKAP